MCVVIPFILDVRLACGRTSRGHTGGRSHIISPPSFCGDYLTFSRDKYSVHFPCRLRNRMLFTHELIVLHLLGILYIIYIWGGGGKILVCVTAPGFERSSQRQKLSRLPTNHRAGRPVCIKHQIQPECMENEQADAGRDGRTRLARSNSQARTVTGKLIFSCSADHASRNGNLTRLVHALLLCMSHIATIHSKSMDQPGKVVTNSRGK